MALPESAVAAEESRPLLGAGLDSRQVTEPEDSLPVGFDPSGDPENPLDWPPAVKWTIVALLALMGFTVTFTCMAVVPIANLIVSDLSHGGRSKSASVLLVTIWELGEAAGPLLISPLSEVVGRYPVMNVANFLFVFATVLAALCRSTPLFIAARAMTGLAVASNVLSPAIVGDMFISEQRGSAMSIIMVAPLLGGAISPVISGAVTQGLGWRWAVLICAVLAGACEVLFLVFFRETYKVPILRKKAARLHQRPGPAVLKSAAGDGRDAKHAARKLFESIMRPGIVLLDSGVLMVLSLFGSVSFAFFYVMSVTLPDILEGIYGLSQAAIGTAFLTFSVGSLIGVVCCNLLLDRTYVKLRNKHDGVGHPEHRLPLSIIGALIVPCCVLAYGWAAELHLPLELLLCIVGFQGAALLLTTLPLMAYVVDAFGLYSASALTGVIVSRCLVGTFLPLTTTPLIDHLGYGWGFTALAGLCLTLAPVPVVVMRYGSRWRGRSRYTGEA